MNPAAVSSDPLLPVQTPTHNSDHETKPQPRCCHGTLWRSYPLQQPKKMEQGPSSELNPNCFQSFNFFSLILFCITKKKKGRTDKYRITSRSRSLRQSPQHPSPASSVSTATPTTSPSTPASKPCNRIRFHTATYLTAASPCA